MDTFRSLFTLVFSILFIIIMFPFTFILWLAGTPFGKGRVLAHRMLTFQGRVLIAASPLWKVEVSGRENYVPGQNYVMISNHQSLLDIPLMKYLGMSFRWVSKVENFRVPVLGQSMRMAGYISVTRGKKESVISMMKRSEQALKSGESIFIFPEGRRLPGDKIGRFKSGAFRLALSTGTPILPVLIDGTGEVFRGKGMILGSGHRLKLKVLEPLKPSDFMSDDPDRLASAMQTMMNQALEQMRKDERQ
ncbi:MAG: 1-acyl-sn-glycerol-3-phosphate acyltransferase [Bacteroidales bacterium]|nr:1-acyl-sn-glycerol-3-phosphate acyltransferase [Bacteroidales bacterium]